jgi:hypothetical protein
MKNTEKSIEDKLTHPKTLWKIWIVFTFIFLVLSCFHFIAATKIIEPFEIIKLKKAKLPGYFVNEYTGVDIQAPLRNFAKDFNQYIEDYNNQSRNQNILAAIGYGIAFLTALISMILDYRNAQIAQKYRTCMVRKEI